MCANNIIAKILILILLSLTGYGQSLSFKFVNINVKNGLSSNTVNTIIKDKTGFMWFGTDDGLNKFDGKNITIYRHDPADKNSIGKGSIKSIIYDANGNFWIGAGENLSRYDPKLNTFTNVDFSDRGTIRSLAADKNGQIWVGTYSGLFLFDPKTKEAYRFESNPSDKNAINSNIIISIYIDSKNRVWVSTNKGLHLYNRKTRQFVQIPTQKQVNGSIPNVIIRSLVEDKNGNIWVATDESGVVRINLLTLKVDSVVQSGPNSIRSNKIFALALNEKNELWIGTEEGVDIFDISTGKVTPIISSKYNNFNLVGKSVRSIYIDNQGLYWISTHQGGVNRYDRNLAFFDLRQSNQYDEESLTNPNVTSFAEAENGLVYIGTDGGGLNIFNPVSGKIRRFPSKNPAIKSINDLCLANGKLYIGTNFNGIQVLNVSTGQITELKLDKDLLTSSDNSINTFLKDKKGNIWIGTNGNGVFKYHVAQEKIIYYNKTSKGNSNLNLNGYITCIKEDQKGQIWIGSNDTGIGVINSEKDDVIQIINSANSNLKTDRINDIYCDVAGNVWVATYGDGLFLYKNKNFLQYSTEYNLANGVIYKILADDSQNLWVSTNSGISRFDPKRQNFKNYYSQNGLQPNVFNHTSGFKSTNGTLYFGGLEGLNFFRPNNLNQNKSTPPLVFTDLKIANQSVSAVSSDAIKENITFATEIHLEYGQNFSLEYSTLNYTSPYENRYAYQLEGFEENWNNVGRATNAVYTNLDPGTYTFKLKAFSEDKSWETEVKSITIYVIPPFYRTKFAYFIYAFLIFLTQFFYRRYGVRKLQRQFELEQKTRDTEQKSALDKLKIKFLTNISHELKTPLTLILSPLEKVFKSENDPSKAELLSLIIRNANRLNNLVSQLLDFKHIEENETKLNATENDMIEVVKNIFVNLQKSYVQKSLTFIFDSKINNYWCLFDKEKIERVIINILSNATKFTPEGGEILLKITKNGENGIEIVISDTGIGIPETEIDKIFDRFYHQESNGELNQGNGIGLSIAKDFIQLHDGSIRVESTKCQGAAFCISLPMPETIKPLQEAVDHTSLPEKFETAKLQSEPEGYEQKPVIILVEDNQELRNYLANSLKSKYKIIQAENGAVGWNKTLALHPEVIVTDVHMPEMDGFTLLSKIKNDKRTKHLPVLILTVLNTKESHELALKTGASDYLIKPFNERILDIKISNLISQNRLMKETYSKQVNIAIPDLEIVSEDQQFIGKAILYIENNINNANLSVDALAKYMNVSRGTLYSKTIELTGETPIELIKTIKLTRAAALLEKSDLKIAQICYECGFSNPNYFSRAFKSKYDISPSDYIAQKRQV